MRSSVGSPEVPLSSMHRRCRSAGAPDRRDRDRVAVGVRVLLASTSISYARVPRAWWPRRSRATGGTSHGGARHGDGHGGAVRAVVVRRGVDEAVLPEEARVRRVEHAVVGRVGRACRCRSARPCRSTARPGSRSGSGRRRRPCRSTARRSAPPVSCGVLAASSDRLRCRSPPGRGRRRTCRRGRPRPAAARSSVRARS